jgi:hypothetical protein
MSGDIKHHRLVMCFWATFSGWLVYVGCALLYGGTAKLCNAESRIFSHPSAALQYSLGLHEQAFKEKGQVYLWRGMIVLGYAIEIMMNVRLGFTHLNSKSFRRRITWATVHTSLTREEAIVALCRTFWAVWVLAVGMAVFDLWYTDTRAKESATPWGTIAGITIGANICGMCGLWMWTNWIMYRAVQQLIKQQEVQAKGSYTAMQDLLDEMERESDAWAFNHLVRLITTPVIATSFYGAFNAMHVAPTKHGFDRLLFAFLGYAAVWFSAIVPGYVNDNLFGQMHAKLEFIMSACAYNEQESPEDLRQHHFVLLPLMQLVQVAKGRKGMHFAYVHMSCSKAMLVGTLVTYMVQLATRLNGRA